MAPQPRVSDQLEVKTEGKVLIVTLRRPQKLNAVNPALQADLERLLDWYEEEASLWCLVLTGTREGRNAFCAGMDLAEAATSTGPRGLSRHGFASLSRRYSTKPFLCAVNGICLGGGLEIIMNADLVVAAESAKFGFPEVTRGVTAAQGGIPRAAAICGHVLAAELLLTGKIISAKEARDRFGFVNEVVADDQVLVKTLAIAHQICSNSPDAVQLTKRSLEEARRFGCGGVEKATIRAVQSDQGQSLWSAENLREGLTAFAERRKPKWSDPPMYKAKL